MAFNLWYNQSIKQQALISQKSPFGLGETESLKKSDKCKGTMSCPSQSRPESTERDHADEESIMNKVPSLPVTQGTALTSSSSASSPASAPQSSSTQSSSLKSSLFRPTSPSVNSYWRNESPPHISSSQRYLDSPQMNTEMMGFNTNNRDLSFSIQNSNPALENKQQQKQRLLLSPQHPSLKHEMNTANPTTHPKMCAEFLPDHFNKSPLPSTCDVKNIVMSFAQSHPQSGSTPTSSHQYPGIMPGKTRIRTSFDPEHEIPRLQKWFSDNQHPTREQMMRFMQELNNLESRKGRRPLDLTNIIYWFKNARAAQRRANKMEDTSLEHEDNLEIDSKSNPGVNQGNGESQGIQEASNVKNETTPPYLPNKNAVYMIPFHPYPHLMSGNGPTTSGTNANDVERSSEPLDASSNVSDEPYDLSVSKRSSSESDKSTASNRDARSNSNNFEEGSNGKEQMNYYNSPKSPKMSPGSPDQHESSSVNVSETTTRKTMSGHCVEPRFPALLDVVSKMRREIPPSSDDVYNNNNTITINNSNNTSPTTDTDTALTKKNNIDSNIRSYTDNGQRSNSRPVSRCSNACESSIKTEEEMDQSFSDRQDPPRRDNGYSIFPHQMRDMKLNCEDQQFDYYGSGSDMELGQIKKVCLPISQRNGNGNCSDDDNSNDSYESEEEIKVRMNQKVAAVAADYASAMHNNMSRLTAANMAALSLAQMGQPLHIPQMPPSLAMAYYPMDLRFYSQQPVSTSLTSSSSPTPTSSHLIPHQTDHMTSNSLMDPASPLAPPSPIHHSMSQHNQHQIHHQQHHQHQHQQQQQNLGSHSEPRKRRTRVFIDPLSEIPKLENWFKEDTHPSAFMIDKFCEELNKCEYRQKFPKLEPKNIQLWFKNHRAKVKRLKVSFNGEFSNCKIDGDFPNCKMEAGDDFDCDGDGDVN